MKYQILEHTADLKIKAWGKNLAELFSNLAEGMYSVMTGNKPQIKNQKLAIIAIKVKGNSVEELLVNWLNELLFLTETKQQIYYDFKFDTISERELNVIAQTASLSQVEIEIKAATFHDLKIAKIDDYLTTTVVFDI